MPDESVWRDEAVRKGFPERFVERLAASDTVSEEEKRKIVDSLSTAAAVEQDLAEMSLRDREILNKDPGVLRTVNKTREEWVACGRALGEDEVGRRREVGAEAEQRVRRAMAYAAWEWDGKPLGLSEEYHAEFGIRTVDVMPSHDRPAPQQNGES